MARHTQATGHEAADRRQDTRFMRQALRLAARGEGFTRPNPPVGAVVVRDGRVIGRGYHRAAGLPHAEVEALNACRESARGATLYVTLEPCSTTGRTPPCTGRIVQEGLARVCIGCLDPNPRHAGRGITRLREAGIAVETGICETACRELIEPFTRHILDQRPMVTLKLALTLDGRLADRERRSKWITGETARAWVQRLRRRTDAIMVGAGTVLADDPELRCRLPGAGAAWRVVVDGTGRLPAGRRLFTDAYAARTIVATTPEGAERLRQRLPAHSPVTLWSFNPDQTGGIPLDELLRHLAREKDVMHVLCEGGAQLAGALVKAHLVDECHLVYAPLMLGDADALGAFEGIGWLLPEARRGRISAVRRLGADLLVTLRPEAECRK